MDIFALFLTPGEKIHYFMVKYDFNQGLFVVVIVIIGLCQAGEVCLFSCFLNLFFT
jgi:hypothetical protein